MVQHLYRYKGLRRHVCGHRSKWLKTRVCECGEDRTRDYIVSRPTPALCVQVCAYSLDPHRHPRYILVALLETQVHSILSYQGCALPTCCCTRARFGSHVMAEPSGWVENWRRAFDVMEPAGTRLIIMAPSRLEVLKTCCSLPAAYHNRC